jgi:C-terminal processing protease CtpA/Prc
VPKSSEREKGREGPWSRGLVAIAWAVLVVFLAGAGACSPSTGSVGAILGKDVHTGRLYVREVAPGMAAAFAGLRDGDEILAIEGNPVADMPPGEVHRRLQGSVGSKVTLLILRDGLTHKIDVVRTALAAE